MTRQEFIDTICNFGELLDFCRDENLEDSLDWYYDIYDCYEVRDKIEEDITDALHSNYWYNIRDMLNEIPSVGNWFMRQDTLVYENLDSLDALDEYKNDVLRYMDRHEMWDEEWDEDDAETETEVSAITSAESASVIDEPFTIEELLFSTSIKGEKF